MYGGGDRESNIINMCGGPVQSRYGQVSLPDRYKYIEYVAMQCNLVTS